MRYVVNSFVAAIRQSGKRADRMDGNLQHKSRLIKNFTNWIQDYSHAPHNDVSVNDGPHIRRFSYNIIL